MSVALLEVRGLDKRFGSTHALRDVSFAVSPGEVMALMGANGAGKSTLVKILCGAFTPDAGSLLIDGSERLLSSPAVSRALGIVAVHQATDSANVPGLTVAENLVLDAICGGRLPALLTPRRLRAEAEAVARALGLDLPLDRILSSLPLADRQLVSIARALAGEARLLILDEPTASLSEAESSRLFALVEQLSARGVAVLLVSHRLGDLQRAAHRAVVLRDGGLVGDFPRPIDFAAALGAMVGVLPDANPRPKQRGAPILRAEALRLRPGGPPLNLALHAGEVTVLFGPLGTGKSRLLATVFGASRAASGMMTLDGAAWAPGGPADAIRTGVFLAAEDRWRTSFSVPGTLGADIEGTIGFPHLPRWTRWPGLVPKRRQTEAARAAIDRLGIVCRGPDDRIETLSGGNQQKVVLARWSATQAHVLLLDEPFAGVDVRARHDIVAALRALGPSTAVLVATSDAEEALEAGDRILVMRPDGVHEAAVADLADGAALLARASRLEQEQAA